MGNTSIQFAGVTGGGKCSSKPVSSFLIMIHMIVGMLLDFNIQDRKAHNMTLRQILYRTELQTDCFANLTNGIKPSNERASLTTTSLLRVSQYKHGLHLRYT
ncbi:hypothetical protein GDO81_019469 [Engystomops pustulosus]|uniref:Uncharacterized protein n=1 Tax=Engystomops pustulosus TaxID=76066 RepID=A0AAV6YA37_ENGPU|nr:hypothetical protein GDO81_019469 [Engystomops pustulosus]